MHPEFLVPNSGASFISGTTWAVVETLVTCNSAVVAYIYSISVGEHLIKENTVRSVAVMKLTFSYARSCNIWQKLIANVNIAAEEVPVRRAQSSRSMFLHKSRALQPA